MTTKRTKKESGLASYAVEKAVPQAAVAVPGESAPVAPAEKKKRGRGKGPVVTISVRLPRNEWQRLHMLGVTEGKSIQVMAIEGLSTLFVKNGLPELDA